MLTYMIPSRVRREVLCSLLLDDRDWHPRELARILGLSNSAVALELTLLHRAGIASYRRVGNQSRYRADPDCPVYAELRGLLVKTAGVADRLRSALIPLAQAGQVDLAYIFGSFADGSQRGGSDVDVMVVGPAKVEAVLEALAPVEHALRREVNSVVYDYQQYKRELARGAGFIHVAHTGHRIMLIGAVDGPA